MFFNRAMHVPVYPTLPTNQMDAVQTVNPLRKLNSSNLVPVP